MLLDEGANINACNSNKETPLHLAAANGHLEVVQDLLKAKAYFSVVDGQQRSALYRAVESGYNRVVDLLVGAGARFGQLPPVSFFDRSTQTLTTGDIFLPEIAQSYRGFPYLPAVAASQPSFCLCLVAIALIDRSCLSTTKYTASSSPYVGAKWTAAPRPTDTTHWFNALSHNPDG